MIKINHQILRNLHSLLIQLQIVIWRRIKRQLQRSGRETDQSQNITVMQIDHHLIIDSDEQRVLHHTRARVRILKSNHLRSHHQQRVKRIQLESTDRRRVHHRVRLHAVDGHRQILHMLVFTLQLARLPPLAVHIDTASLLLIAIAFQCVSGSLAMLQNNHRRSTRNRQRVIFVHSVYMSFCTCSAYRSQTHFDLISTWFALQFATRRRGRSVSRQHGRWRRRHLGVEQAGFRSQCLLLLRRVARRCCFVHAMSVCVRAVFHVSVHRVCTSNSWDWWQFVEEVVVFLHAVDADFRLVVETHGSGRLFERRQTRI